MIDGDADFVLLSSAHGGQELEEMLDQIGIPCAKFDIENFEDYLNLLKICTDITGRADLNCENIADITPSLLEELSIEKIIELDPDFIFITIMGSDEEKARESYQKTLLSNPAWNELTAVKNGRCVFLPTKYFHNKPNAEWDKAYEMLAEILNDE